MVASTILIIEDDDLNQTIFKDLLEMEGFTVLLAMDAETGIEVARQEMPDLILMDIQLPGMDGFKAASIIHSDEALKAIPIVALTGGALLTDAECFDGYVTKPIDIKSFIKQVNAHLK